MSKLTISPVPILHESSRTVVQTKTSQTSHQQRISDNNFLPTPPAVVETTVRSFYPTPRPSPKPSQSVTHQSVTQRIHHRLNSPGVTVPQLKPHQITINLSPPDIRRIVQNPSPLLPSQSRVIVTAKASVSDESGRPLNTTQLVTLPLPTIPASYDDYKEGDESFDPFYRDVPKIPRNRQVARNTMEKTRLSRRKRSHDQLYHLIYGADNRDGDSQEATRKSESRRNQDEATNLEDTRAEINVGDFQAIRESLIKFRDILFNDEADEDAFRNSADEIENTAKHVAKDSEILEAKSEKVDVLEDLKTDASRHLMLDKEADEKGENEKSCHEDSSLNVEANTEKLLDKKKHIKNTSESESKLKFETNIEFTTARSEENKSRADDIDVTILDNDFKVNATNTDVETSKTDAPIEIIIEEENKSDLHDGSKTNEKVIHNGQLAGYLTKDESEKRSSFITDAEKPLSVSQVTTERKIAKDSREQKSGSRRKASRARSSRRRISSRIKQENTKNVEVTETIQQREKMDETTTTIIGIITTTPTITTTTPSIVLFEAKVAEQIDSHIFGESESQTSKEADARAVGQRDGTSSKSLRDGKSHDVKRSKEIGRSFDHQIMEKSARNLDADKSEEAEQKTEYISLEDTNFTENPQSSVETESTEVSRVPEEKKSDEEFFSKEYETSDDDDEESNANTKEKKFEASSEETSNKISSRKVAVPSREDDSEQESSYREDSSEKTSADDSNEEEHSTTKYSEEINHEESNEYPDTTIESSAENSRDTSVQEDYIESTEEYTTSVDYTSSEEYNDSEEDVTDSTEDAGDSTEGILKFTDELPRSDDRDDENAETKETSEFDENDAHDYVDDNYEPENYKEMETATESNNSKEEKNEENDGEKRDAASIDPDLDKKDLETHRSDDEAKTQTEHAEGNVTEVTGLEKVTSLATTVSSTTTMSSTSTTTSTTTTPRPTITTTRSTSPKLFKPIGNRRIYAYSPPTTTPIPVVIKSRLGLFNPKPAKPPKSYNELAPKPVIRKLALTRKPSTTIAATTAIITTEMLNTKNPTETTTEPVTTMTMTAVMTTTTESGRSEENVLESKLEANEPISVNSSAKSDRTNKEDQLSSPTEQNSPVNSSKDADPRISTEEIETSTLHLLSRLTTLASPVEQTTIEMENEPQETTERIDISTSISLPLTTLPLEKSYIETSTDKYPEEAETTTASAKVSQQYVTETPSVLAEHPTPSVSTIPTSTVSTTSTTVQLKAEDVDPVATTESAIHRPSSRKYAGSRKQPSFNCLEKEMYRFYGDARDCRLFHYCSPGFTARQVLDFRFVCEEGTAFDEETQSCRHDVRNRKCRNRSW